MHMTCNHDNLVRLRVGDQKVLTTLPYGVLKNKDHVRNNTRYFIIYKFINNNI